MDKKSALHSLLLIGALATLGVAAVLAGPVQAAKGGKVGNRGHAGLGSGASSASCSVSPERVSPGESYTIQGNGFAADQNLAIRVTTDRGSAYFGAWTDASGSFEHQGEVGYATPVTVDVLDGVSELWKAPVLASCSFEVL